VIDVFGVLSSVGDAVERVLESGVAAKGDARLASEPAPLAHLLCTKAMVGIRHVG
jgi:hypothetical protein